MKIVNILPRNSGKTTTALNLLLNNLESTLLIVPTNRYKHEIISGHPILHDDIPFTINNRTGDIENLNISNIENIIITPRNFTNTYLIGKIIRKIIIDEYFFIDSQQMKSINENINFVNGNGEGFDIIVFSSADREYPIDLFNFIKKNKTVLTYQEIKEQMESEYPILLIDKLYHNIITDIDTTLVIGPGKMVENDMHIRPYLEYLNMPFY